MTVPEITTRRPTGKPPFPLVLLAGAEKTGKSYAAAALSASGFVDRTFWIEIGEGAADQYGALPGARYEIVQHDGTYQGIGNAIYAATQQPRPNGKPHAIVIDSMTELWDMLAEEAQGVANERAARKRNGKPADSDAQITMDLWNAAKKRWRRIIDTVRTYDGPVILTARLELVTVMSDEGKPTTAKDWKIRSEKNLPFECDVIVRMPAPGVAELTGVRSLRVQVPPNGALPMPGFTLEQLLTDLGLAEDGATAPRSYTAPTAVPADAAAEAAAEGGQGRRERTRTDDEWSTNAPKPEPISKPQMDKLHILLKEHGLTTRVAALARITQILDLRPPLETTKALTKAQASKVIDELEKTKPAVDTPPEFDVFVVLQEMIAQVNGEASFNEAQAAILAEEQRNEISPEDAGILRERLAKHAEAMQAGAAA